MFFEETLIRNGLDMAYSDNQNQLIFWGQHYFKEEMEVTPQNSLKYWCKVHKDLIVNTQLMQEDFYLLNFDEFCNNPSRGLSQLNHFLGFQLQQKLTEHLLNLVIPPRSIGRYKKYDLSVFNPTDIAYVKHLGFDTS